MLKITWILITILTAIVFNKIILNKKISKIPSYLFSFIFLILSLLFINTTNLWILSMGAFFIIISYGEMITSNKNNNLHGRILKASIFIGIAGLLDYSLYFFALINLLLIISDKEINWRSIIIQILGLSWPFLFIFIVTSLYPNGPLNMMPQNLLTTTTINLSQKYISLCILGIIFIPAIMELYHNFHKKNDTAKKAYAGLLLMSVIVMILAIINQSFAFIYFLTIPLTLVITNYLLYTKHRYFRTFLLGLLLISILLEFFYL